LTVEVRCDGNHARIGVRDRGKGFTPPNNHRNGSGFAMVHGLSGHFGMSGDGHTHAWAKVELV
jgi:LytS/YehU family sensor histidine kinase